MNESHRRHLLATLRHVDQLLTQAERVLVSADSASPFASHAPLDPPLQPKVIQDYLRRVRESLRRALEDLHLPRAVPASSTVWTARSHIAQATVGVGELTAEHLSGYGELDANDASLADGVAADLKAALDRLSAYLSQDQERAIEARLQRLASRTNPEASEGPPSRGAAGGGSEAPEQATGDIIALLCELEEIITRHGLVEFRGPLANLLDRLEQGSFEIGIFGRVKAGKSSLLNYLLGIQVLPRGVTPVTALPTRVKFGLEPRALIEMSNSDEVVEVELERLAEYATEQQNPANAKQVRRIDVEVPVERLRDGVTFVDTPGLGSLATGGARETEAYLPRCDLGLVLVDAASTLNEIDLMLVQALDASGARAMVLVSRSDLLSVPDLENTMHYVRQQLNARLGSSPVQQSNTDMDNKRCTPEVPLFSISVVDRAPLCDHWFEAQLEPIFQTHRQQLAESLRRKVGGLCEAVMKSLQARHLQGSGPSEEARSALLAIRQANAQLESAQRGGDELVDATGRLAPECLNVLAGELTQAWEQHSDVGEALNAALASVLSSHTSKILALLEATREQLEHALAVTQRASGGVGVTELLPRPASLPLFDPSVVLAGLTLPKPMVLPHFLGNLLLRRYALSRLEQPLREPMQSSLNEHSQRLRPWLFHALSELREAFQALVLPLRAQLEGGASSNGGEAEGDLRHLRARMGLGPRGPRRQAG